MLSVKKKARLSATATALAEVEEDRSEEDLRCNGLPETMQIPRR